MRYAFENECGEMRIITGDIMWGYNFEWMLKESKSKSKRSVSNNSGVMPLGDMCLVKSYEFNMRGLWKLVEIRK